MRSFILTGLLAVLINAAPAHAARIGDSAPAFDLATADGRSVSLDGLRGNVVYVDFWASWCVPCKQSFPWMNALQDRHRGERFAIVAINVDKHRPDAERFLRDVPATFPVVFDAAGATPAAFDVKGMPSSYLIDRNGKVVAIEEGFHDDRVAAIEAQIRALLATR
jgi:cytochrome c biogenesis protein CcmG/thiol:disulfide interchange protein DsbE